MIYRNITQLIGKTPLVALENIQKELRLKARLLAKIEYFNPSGSVKDRRGIFHARGGRKTRRGGKRGRSLSSRRAEIRVSDSRRSARSGDIGSFSPCPKR